LERLGIVVNGLYVGAEYVFELAGRGVHAAADLFNQLGKEPLDPN
jgi:hypothetical protein